MPKNEMNAATCTHIMRNGWRVEVLSGAGAKGPAAIVLSTPHWRVLLDAGATLNPQEYGRTEPWLARAISPHQTLDAALISHDHVDHIGAANQLPLSVPIYCTAQVAQALAPQANWQALPLNGQTVLHKENAPALYISTGANGHSLGGVWLHITDEAHSTEGLFYSGDFSVESALFAFHCPPRSELALLDASYGNSDTPQTQHIQTLKAYLQAPSILPVPASGRALELALWLPQNGFTSWSMDAQCYAALDLALQAPETQFQPGVFKQLQTMQQNHYCHTDGYPSLNTTADIWLLADPLADGQNNPFLKQWIAEQNRLPPHQTASHQLIYTGYLPDSQRNESAHIQMHSLRWNVHPRRQDLVAVLQQTQAQAWQPLFTSELSATDLSVPAQ